MTFSRLIGHFLFCFLFVMFTGIALVNEVSYASEQQKPLSLLASEDDDAQENIPAIAPVFEGYLLGPEDQIELIVYGEDELSGKYTVSDVGFISVPLIGEVGVAGLTIMEAEDLVEAYLRDGYLVDPSVSIEIFKYRPFYIMGEVRTPGKYDYINDMSILKAVALAGGYTYRANKKSVRLVRSAAGKHEQDHIIDKTPVSARIVPGDIVIVKERFF